MQWLIASRWTTNTRASVASRTTADVARVSSRSARRRGSVRRCRSRQRCCGSLPRRAPRRTSAHQIVSPATYTPSTTQPETGPIAAPISPVPWRPRVIAICRFVVATFPEPAGPQRLGTLWLGEDRQVAAAVARPPRPSKWSPCRCADDAQIDNRARPPTPASAIRQAGPGRGLGVLQIGGVVPAWRSIGSTRMRPRLVSSRSVALRTSVSLPVY